MRIRDLEYFNQLVRMHNFTQVGQYFSVSQPTITYAIKRLEQELQSQLIQVQTKPQQVLITTAGQQFYVHSQNIVTELKRAQLELDNQKKEKIILGLPPIIGKAFFPKYINQLNQAGVIEQLETVTVGSGETLKQLLEGKINLAIVASSENLVQENLNVVKLAQSQFKIIVSPELDLPKETIHFVDMTKYPFVAFDEGYVHNKVFGFLISRNQNNPKIVYRTTDVDVLKKMVEQNVGIALLTELAITKNDQLRVLSLSDDQLPSFNVYLAYRHDYQLTATEQKFIEIMKQTSNE
ncbi:LysR family transcriptional regulator [Paucilactobacillus sp. N302-9]